MHIGRGDDCCLCEHGWIQQAAVGDYWQIPESVMCQKRQVSTSAVFHQFTSPGRLNL